MYSEDQLTVKMINELYRLGNQIENKKKTIILYDLFENREEHAVQLNNLHVCSQVILDQDLNVKILKEEDEEGNTTNKYAITEEQKSQKTIIKRVFQIEPAPEGQQSYLDNIWIYDVQGGDLRVVVVPIQQDMIDTDIIRREAEQDKEEDIKVKKSFKEDGLQNEQLKKAQKDWEKIKKERFDKRCQIARQKHIKMFRIEALMNTVLQKTEEVSIACFMDISDRRFKDLAGFMTEFPRLFSVPNDFVPQYILHKFTTKNKVINAISEKEEISTVFSMNEGKFGIKKFQSLNEKYFFSPQNIRTKMYENMEKNDNEAIKFVIQQFVSNFDRIAVESALAFTTVVNRARSIMQEDSSSEEQANMSFEASSYKDIPTASNFQEIFEKYITPSLWLPTVTELEKFYTPQRLHFIRPQKGHPPIPRSIENLVFIHYFYKIGRDFLEKYTARDIEVKGSQVQLLKLWKDGLRQIYSLINEANVTFLQLQENEQFKCKDITRFFNFVMFTIDSLEKIKTITKRDIPTASELRSNFEALKFKKESILSYIIRNEKKIKKQQPIHYYDLLLLIIEQNASKDVAKDMEYIFLHIHELKAYLIATNYIYDIEKVIEAIKSYALIIIGYANLNPNKRDLIDIVTIFKRLARLLKVAGLEEEAAEIYTKLREMEFTDKCYSTILAKSSLNGDEKAKKLLTWGKTFQAQFEYDLAQKYYRKAFSFAKDISIKQMALKSKIDCNAKIRAGPSEEELRMHLNFQSDGDYLAYIGKVQINKMLKELRQKLKWDSKSKTSIIMVGDDEGGNGESSFLNNLQNVKESCDNQITEAS